MRDTMNNWILIVSITAFTLYNGVICHRHPNIKALTYNTALRNTFALREFEDFEIPETQRVQRRDKLIETLSNIDADLVCLQEVWLAEDLAAIVHGVRKSFKYSFSQIHTGKRVAAFQHPSEGPLCREDEFNFECLSDECEPELTFEGFLSCVSECFLAIPSADESCLTCILATFPTEDLARCFGIEDLGPLAQTNNNGLLLLSKKKLSNTHSEDFFPTTKEIEVNGYLSAKVGGLKAVCTQLTFHSLAEYVEFDLADAFGFQSYSDQNAFEANILMSRFRDAKKLLLLGDFGSGPAGAVGVMASFEVSHLYSVPLNNDSLLTTTLATVAKATWLQSIKNNYNALAAAFSTTVLNQCTFCNQDENPYNSDEVNFTVDHVFARGLCIQNVKRMLTQRDASVLIGAQMVPLSDHFGVGANIVPSPVCESLNNKG